MNMDDVGKRIKELRLNKNLSQSELADKLIITPQAISKWERGVSLPDVTMLQSLSEIFGVSISYLLSGGDNKDRDFIDVEDKKKKKVIVLAISVLILILIGVIIWLVLNNNFKLNKISTTCKDFKITGSAAYNQSKSSIYISDVNYCGSEEDIEYKNIQCILYESFKDTEIKINQCDVKDNIKLNDYLEDLQINVDNYSYTCKDFSKSKLYLQINATDKSDKTISYKIPISLETNCKN